MKKYRWVSDVLLMILALIIISETGGFSITTAVARVALAILIMAGLELFIDLNS